MLKKSFAICMILAFCLVPLTGCDQPTDTPADTPTTAPKIGPRQPVHLDIDGNVCQIKVDSEYGDDKKQDFVMNVVCNGEELFNIDIDGQGAAGSAEAVDVDVFGKSFLSWGNRK